MSDLIGHNSDAVPLAEILADETAAMKRRADDLIAAAERADVTDDATASRATTLAKLIGEHVKIVDDAREQRKRPHLDAGRIVDRHFGAIATPLADAKKRVMNLINDHIRRQEAAAAAERKRLEEEAARQRAEAARLAREAHEAALIAEEAGKPAPIDAELEAAAAADAAEAALVRAASVTVAPIVSDYGFKAHQRAVSKVRILNMAAALKHALAIDRPTIEAAVLDVYQRQVRAKVTSLPGAEIYQETSTVVR